MIHRVALLGLMLASISFAQTSNDDERLKAALKRYPQADADQNGILTLAEAQAFKSQRGKDQNKEAGLVPEGGKRQIYKRVGEIELPLYVYAPAGHAPDAKAPAVVFFFGGGWSTGSPTQFEQQCKHLASRGMVAITVEYRVASRHPVHIEDCIEDAKSAMRWVRANAATLGVNPNRIASGGGSAGGHLAACVALIDGFDAKTDDTSVSPKPNAMVLFNPAMALADDERLSKAYRARVAEGVRRASEDKAKISPLAHASQTQPPCLMLFGTADELLEGAQLFQKDSEASGNSCKLVTYEGQGHGFFNFGARGGRHYELTLAEMDRFFVGLGWLKQDSRYLQR